MDNKLPETKDEIIQRLQKRITALEINVVNCPAYVKLLNENARLQARLKAINKLVGNHGKPILP